MTITRLRKASTVVQNYLWSGCATTKVFYIVDDLAWAIFHEGKSVEKHLRNIEGAPPLQLTNTSLGLKQQLIHFGCLWLFDVAWPRRIAKNNRLIVTVYHGARDMDQDYARAFDKLTEAIPWLSAIVVSCKIMEERLISYGFPVSIMHRIPIGVDTQIFSPVTATQKQKLRQQLSIPQGAFCVGSFQKDGVGWGDGMEPKLIKGPDILVDVLSKAKARIPTLFVVLTGPARGFVKHHLEKAGIPYCHHFFNNPDEVAPFYQAIDATLVTSREEGGPKAVLESMACGVPVLSTRVGMAPDYIEDGVNSFLFNHDEPERFVDILVQLAENGWSPYAAAQARAAIAPCDWHAVASQHAALYHHLLTALKREKSNKRSVS